jgi:hypothetical protein
MHWSDAAYWLAAVYSCLRFFLKHILPEIGREIIKEMVKETIASLKHNLLGCPGRLKLKPIRATIQSSAAVNVRLIQGPNTAK